MNRPLYPWQQGSMPPKILAGLISGALAVENGKILPAALAKPAAPKVARAKIPQITPTEFVPSPVKLPGSFSQGALPQAPFFNTVRPTSPTTFGKPALGARPIIEDLNRPIPSRPTILDTPIPSARPINPTASMTFVKPASTVIPVSPVTSQNSSIPAPATQSILNLRLPIRPTIEKTIVKPIKPSRPIRPPSRFPTF